MFKRVLLCYDGSDAGRRALRRGAELAIQLGAEVHVLSIVPETVANAAVIACSIGEACVVEDSRGYRRLLDQSLEWLKQRGVSAEGYLATGNTIDQIVAHAKRLAVDLIVLGHYPQPKGGLWWSSAQQRGSLTERAGCCVFVAVSGPDDAGTPP
jgi:nucleotide-binding universal stress UspA family protein